MLNLSKNRHLPSRWILSALALSVLLVPYSVIPLEQLSGSQKGKPDPAAEEFFEKSVRPVLATRCFTCHGLEKQMRGLRLDSLASILKGGESGPALVPGDPDRSLLISAIRYQNPNLQMPPTGKLPEEETAALARWIAMGAYWPDAQVVQTPKQSVDASVNPFTDQQLTHWSFQPVKNPAIPPVNDKSWPKNPVDHFVLSALEAKGMRPALPADKRTLIRRATFDLIGLPPTPQEIDAFVADQSLEAFRKVVDRLLASPHYGERWARHWLDLTGFAETNGHEYDREKLNAWRYRDYVIRAFNEDIPYDRFIKEQLAGDLLTEQRLTPDGQTLESAAGTGFFWLSDMLSDTLDTVKSRADQVDAQIDAFGKTFLGLTLGCARCHDHKFDPVTAKDYYGLAGFFHSTVLLQNGSLDSPAKMATIDSVEKQLAAIDGEIQALSERIAHRALAPQVAHLKDYLLAARDILNPLDPKSRTMVAKLAADRGLDQGVLQGWVDYLATDVAIDDRIFGPWALLIKEPRTSDFQERPKSLHREMTEKLTRSAPSDENVVLFEDFSKPTYENWIATDWAFGSGPTWAGLSPLQPLSELNGGLANSFRFTNAAVGTLVSKPFHSSKRYIHIRTAGGTDIDRSLVRPADDGANYPHKQKVCVRFIVNEFQRVTHLAEDSHRLGWKTAYLQFEFDRDGHLEIIDLSRDQHIAVDRIYFSDDPNPPKIPTPPNRLVVGMLSDPKVISPESLAAKYQQLFQDTMAKWKRSEATTSGFTPDPDREALTHWLLRRENPFLTIAVASQARRLTKELGLQAPGNFFGNWAGSDEKWLKGKEKDEWLFIRPDGKLFRWDGKGPAAGTLVAVLDPVFHADPNLLFSSDFTLMNVLTHPEQHWSNLGWLSSADKAQMVGLLKQRKLLEQQIPDTTFARLATDYQPHDVPVHIRGDHKNLGDMVPRRFLTVLEGDKQPRIIEKGKSGRLWLAERVAGSSNPLTARVMVNRIWQHHFGTGIVSTPDNFGLTGEKPTHPELLDFLAASFAKSGWSTKALHRLIMLSNTYRMSSQADPATAKVDPTNKLLQHFPTRRLEAEIIRDAILAVSGRLDRQLFGPSVPPHIA